MNDADSASGKRAIIDWEEVHRRMEAARHSITQGSTPNPDEQREVLRKRARALAVEPEADSGEERIEILEFALAYERYGFETSHVREVSSLKDLTPVPCTPPFVLGIINVRGQVISVIDLKKFFDLPEKGLGELNKMIILKSDVMEFGVLADVILGVRTLPRNGLQPALPTHTGLREEYLMGISEDGAVILDAGKILSDDGIIVNEQVL